MSTELDRPQIASEIVRCALQMFRAGLLVGTAGNISVRVDDQVIITPSSMSYTLMGPDDLCVVDLNGEQLSGNGRPSSETRLHTNIYRATDARAVIHTHSIYATTIACTRDELPAVHYAIHAFGGDSIRVTGYERFGSVELADSVAAALKARRGVLLRNHGAVVYGSSLSNAAGLAELLEWLARLFWQSEQLGDPHILTGAQVKEVATAARQLRYGQAKRA
jgi:L-fuculose-phosphate aldolase